MASSRPGVPIVWFRPCSICTQATDLPARRPSSIRYKHNGFPEKQAAGREAQKKAPEDRKAERGKSCRRRTLSVATGQARSSGGGAARSLRKEFSREPRNDLRAAARIAPQRRDITR